MSPVNFPSAAYDLSLLPLDEPDVDDSADAAAYARDAKRLDTDDILLIVAERLSNSLIIRSRIEDAKVHPYMPNERRHVHPYDAMKLADEAEDIIADVIDELIEQNLAAADGRVRA